MFEALNQASLANLGETHEDQLAQILVDIQEEGQQAEDEDESEEDDSRGIDLMASDNEGRKGRKRRRSRVSERQKG